MKISDILRKIADGIDSEQVNQPLGAIGSNTVDGTWS